MARFRSYYFLGSRVDDVTLREAVTHCEQLIKTGRPHQIVTTGPEFILKARRNRQFQDVINQSALSLPDGSGTVITGRLTHRPLRAWTAGVDLSLELAALAARRGWKLFLLGGEPGVAEAAAQRLLTINSGLIIAGTYGGTPAEADAGAIIERIRAARPEILLVAYGAPAQDLWIARHLQKLGVPLAIGVGGTLDYISGRVRRAPRLMRRLGLEWLFRLLRQPRRLLRIWRAVPDFTVLVLIEGWFGKKH